MKMVHKSNILEATQFDAVQLPWPAGVTRVTRETATGGSTHFEFKCPVKVLNKTYAGIQDLAHGDYIVTEFDPDTLEEVGRYVVKQSRAAVEFVILGEVTPQ